MPLNDIQPEIYDDENESPISQNMMLNLDPRVDREIG